tara:strand:- start:776 stop:1159 length:384 start_codon:yes stop_codon:yes gene_type:complete
MNGNRYLFDTNAVIQLLRGNQELVKLTQTAEHISISIITQLEFLSFPRLAESDRSLFEVFLSRVGVCGLSHDNLTLVDQVVSFRTQRNLKLPDAIIAATAVTADLRLVTADKALLAALPGSISFSVI